MSTASLRNVYLELTNQQLPALASSRKWPVRFNHCFQRIVLDHLFQDSWYHHLSRKRAAYRQLSEAQLKEAVAFIQQLIDGPDELLQEANRRSLRWRGKG